MRISQREFHAPVQQGLQRPPGLETAMGLHQRVEIGLGLGVLGQRLQKARPGLFDGLGVVFQQFIDARQSQRLK